MSDLKLSIKMLRRKIQYGNKKLKDLDEAIVEAEKKFARTQKVVDYSDVVLLKSEKENLKAELLMSNYKLEALKKEFEEQCSQSQPQ